MLDLSDNRYTMRLECLKLACFVHDASVWLVLSMMYQLNEVQVDFTGTRDLSHTAVGWLLTVIILRRIMVEDEP
jgi:hypothetical protein